MKQHYSILIFLSLFLAGCSENSGRKTSGENDTLVIENIFPYQAQHCHGSTITELPNGDLLVAWFQGSGERTADDVAIRGSRYDSKGGKWSEPFIMADVEGFPDINPVLFVDSSKRLWLVWYTVLAYQWESSIIKYRISTDYMQKEGPPVWSWQDVLHVKADGPAPEGIGKNDPFVNNLTRKYEEYYNQLLSEGLISEAGGPGITREVWDTNIERYMSIAKGTTFMAAGTDIDENGQKIRTRVGYPLMRRIGWQTRNKPLIDGQRILLPLYSDGFDFSLIAISDNNGSSWYFSEPIVGAGSIQPALAFCKDSSVIAYMRDNGPPPKRLMMSKSTDRGKTWSVVRDSEIENSGTAGDMIKLKSGKWALVTNDLEDGRHRLTVLLSDDEGKSWKYRKSLVNGLPGSQTRAHYPAIIQDSEGMIHVSFTNQVPTADGKSNEKNIAHAIFSEKWLMQ